VPHDETRRADELLSATKATPAGARPQEAFAIGSAMRKRAGGPKYDGSQLALGRTRKRPE